MNIRADLKNRWWHSFRTYLDQGITPDLKEKVAAPTSETGQRTTRATSRDYIIANDEPKCASGESNWIYSLCNIPLIISSSFLL